MTKFYVHHEFSFLFHYYTKVKLFLIDFIHEIDLELKLQYNTSQIPT